MFSECLCDAKVFHKECSPGVVKMQRTACPHTFKVVGTSKRSRLAVPRHRTNRVRPLCVVSLAAELLGEPGSKEARGHVPIEEFQHLPRIRGTLHKLADGLGNGVR